MKENFLDKYMELLYSTNISKLKQTHKNHAKNKTQAKIYDVRRSCRVSSYQHLYSLPHGRKRGTSRNEDWTALEIYTRRY